jgi:UDP-glucose 4-epimerase
MIAITGFSGFVGKQLLSSINLNDCLLLGRKAPSRNQKFCEFDLALAQDSKLTESLSPVTTDVVE